MGKRRKKSRPGSAADPAVSHASGEIDDNPVEDDAMSDETPIHGQDAFDSSLDDELTNGTGAAIDSDTGRKDTDLNPQTCCSNCQTVFEVSLELLSSSDTRVRCGECLSIFDALANLRDSDGADDELLFDSEGNIIDSVANGNQAVVAMARSANNTFHTASSLQSAGAAALAGLSNDASALDITYSDFDLFSSEAGLPEVAYFDQTRETPNFAFDELAEDVDETFSDTLFAQDVTVDARSALHAADESDETGDLQNIALDSDIDYVSDEGPRETLIFNYRERETRLPGQGASNPEITMNDSADTSSSAAEAAARAGLLPREDVPMIEAGKARSAWWMRSVLFLLVLLLAGSLYAYRERATLQYNPYVRSLLVKACEVFPCSVPDQVDLASLKVLKRSIFSHPTLDNVLIIQIAFVNQAEFSQAYPVIEIRLTDRVGRLVVKNDVKPADYLDSWQEGDVLDIGKRIDINLNVEDPGRTATSLELDFH